MAPSHLDIQGDSMRRVHRGVLPVASTVINHFRHPALLAGPSFLRTPPPSYRLRLIRHRRSCLIVPRISPPITVIRPIARFRGQIDYPARTGIASVSVGRGDRGFRLVRRYRDDKSNSIHRSSSSSRAIPNKRRRMSGRESRL